MNRFVPDLSPDIRDPHGVRDVRNSLEIDRYYRLLTNRLQAEFGTEDWTIGPVCGGTGRALTQTVVNVNQILSDLSFFDTCRKGLCPNYFGVYHKGKWVKNFGDNDSYFSMNELVRHRLIFEMFFDVCQFLEDVPTPASVSVAAGNLYQAVYSIDQTVYDIMLSKGVRLMKDCLYFKGIGVRQLDIKNNTYEFRNKKGAIVMMTRNSQTGNRQVEVLSDDVSVRSWFYCQSLEQQTK